MFLMNNKYNNNTTQHNNNNTTTKTIFRGCAAARMAAQPKNIGVF